MNRLPCWLAGSSEGMRTSGAPGHVLYLGRYTVLEFRTSGPVVLQHAESSYSSARLPVT